jgi:hypothetical protein
MTLHKSRLTALILLTNSEKEMDRLVAKKIFTAETPLACQVIFTARNKRKQL